MGILGLQIGLQIGVVVQILGVHFSKIGLQIGEVVQIFELKRVGSAPKGHPFAPLSKSDPKKKCGPLCCIIVEIK